MSNRPLVSVYKTDGSLSQDSVPLPHVMKAPIRPDIVHFVHTNVAKNKMQVHAVYHKAGHQVSAQSWGTGRAVSRVSRVNGGGTYRAGQGAYGNMCRGGHMFAPKKVWRRVHRIVPHNIKRYAVVSAIAASSVASLVMARGHRIEGISEVPLVVDDEIQDLKRTKEAVDVLKKINAYQDIERVIDSKTIRAGKGKMRGKRYKMVKGPIICYKEDRGITRAFRNIPGVDLLSVDRLNILKLSPGGTLGRFIIWTKSAFEELDRLYGALGEPSELKKGYFLPKCMVTNPDIDRIISSDAIVEAVAKVREEKTKRRVYLKTLGKDEGLMEQLYKSFDYEGIESE